METWIAVTIAAAFLQNIRSALQKHLKGKMGTTGATFVRFGFGVPFAALFVFALAQTGHPLPSPSAAFLGWTVLGGATQIAATFLLLHLFSFRNFTVGTAYSRTEPAQAALFALVAGVAASLGAGVMTLSGGIGAVTGLQDGVIIRLVITGVIVATYVVSSVSGLQRGIKFLSDINIRFFFMLAAFVLFAGPTFAIFRLGAEGVFEYARDFLPRSLDLGFGADSSWSRDWTIFYYANWLAWAPITALFLGRISVGYTVREFILFNLVAPALFGMLWMIIFGGAAIQLDLSSGGDLTAALRNDGPEAVMYSLLDALPWTAVFASTFVFTTFISFVTAMDSNTHSIASVCLKARRQEDEAKGAGLWIKIFWGVLIGAVAWVMTSTNGVDGIRMLSTLGGVPGLIIMLGCGAVLVRLVFTGMTPRDSEKKNESALSAHSSSL